MKDIERKMQVHSNKALRLDNVLIKEVFNTFDEEQTDNNFIKVEMIVEQMKNQLKNKGTTSIGPLIQYIDTQNTYVGDSSMSLSFMLQAKQFIHNIDHGFRMEAVISVKNCMYVRFQGLEADLGIAYQKMMVEAYEKNIKLKGSSYTIFVESDIEGYIVADIFMEKEDVN